MGLQALVLKRVRSLFFYGTLCHLPLLRLVLGDLKHLQISKAVLNDYAVHWVAGQSFPVIVEARQQVAQGVLVRGLTDDDIARLDFYEGGYDYVLVDIEVRADDVRHASRVYKTAGDRWSLGAPWSLQDWVRDWSEVIMIAAEEIMQGYGRNDPQEVARWFPQIMQRAASQVRAGRMAAPRSVRQGPGRDRVAVSAARRPYSSCFALREMDLTFPHFDGGRSGEVTRAAFVSGDAVTVLPYDPVRDRVMVIEQFRFGPYLRGDPHPWSLEPVAGRIDAGEDPETAALREVAEEAGLAIDRLLPVSRYYPSPGAMTEYLFSYVGLADLPDEAAGLGGLATEAEDIRSQLMSYDALMQIVGSGEAENGPLILTALWLARRREAIRQGA